MTATPHTLGEKHPRALRDTVREATAFLVDREAGKAAARVTTALTELSPISPAGEFALRVVRERANDLRADRPAQSIDLEQLELLAVALSCVARQAETACRRTEFHLRTGTYDAGIESARQAGVLALAADREDLVITALNLCGACLALRGRVDEALESGERALVLSRAFGEESGIAHSLSNVGAICILACCADRAVTPLSDAAERWRRIGDDRQLARTLNNLGLAYFFRGWHGRAQGAAREACERATASGDPAVLAHALATLGQVELALGQPTRARRRFAESRRLAHAASEPRIAAIALALEGRALISLGLPADALTPLEQSVEQLAALGVDDLRAGAADALADALSALGRSAEALRGLAEPSQRARTLLRRAEAMFALGASAQAGAEMDRLGEILALGGPIWGEPDPRLWWRAARVARGIGNGQAAEMAARGDEETRAQSLDVPLPARAAFLLPLHRTRISLLGPPNRTVGPDYAPA